MGRAVMVAAAVLAAVVSTGCGSAGTAPISAPPVRIDGPGTIVLVGSGPSAGLGVDNADLLAATSSGVHTT